MSAGAARANLSPMVLLRLGRVSNLPTVWTNVLAATAIAGGDPWDRRTAAVLLAMSLFYVGGMYLNDAFDRDIDARERPSRPIPAGQIPSSAVFIAGFGMLVAGIALMSLYGLLAGLAGLAIAGVIVAYDMHHKGNRFSPVVMGLCRALVYLGAGVVAVGAVRSGVLIGGLAVMAHVIGLTYAAKQESLDGVDRLWPLAVLVLPLLAGVPALAAGVLGAGVWVALGLSYLVAIHALKTRRRPGSVPRTVAALIAAISIVDAVFAASVGATAVVLAGLLGYALTTALQRVIPGT